MSNEKNIRTLNNEWFDRVWNMHERSAIFELVKDDCQIGGLPPSDQTPKEAFAAFHDTILAAFDKLTITPEVWAEDGQTIVGEGRIKGTHRTTNHDVDFRFSYRAVWKEGQIIEADNIIEWQTALIQTGAQTDSSLENLLLPPT